MYEIKKTLHKCKKKIKKAQKGSGWFLELSVATTDKWIMSKA